MAKNVLLEIGTEEIPAAYLEPARRQLSELAEKRLAEHRLAHGGITTYATPRRLALLIEKLEEKSEDRTEEFLGPSAKAGRAPDGSFTPAAQGFAAKHGTTPEKLIVKTTEKGEYLCVVKKIPGEKAEKVLTLLFPDLIGNLYFPKTMVWEETRFRFARPLKSLIALYGDKVIKFSIAGVKSSNGTTGLHTVSRKKVTVGSPEKYVATLRNNCVIADPAERRKVLCQVIESAARRAKGTVLPSEDLVDEVNYLVEHPVAVLGDFEERFLALPPEVLVTCLKKKQKFFAIADAQGKLTNHFIGIRNGISEHQEVVREGYEKVLTARLDDAAFFFKKDTQAKLETKAERLAGVVFQQKLGTMREKSERVKTLALFINGLLGGYADAAHLERTALLAKADLVTEMVFEYPELQGTVGRIYATHDGEAAEVARAIEEHYWPLSAEGKLPQEKAAVILSLADKFDTLVGDFAVGLIPSGSADPYGLRRMAVGIIRIILEKKLALPLKETIEKAFSLLPSSVAGNQAAAGQVMDFFRQRLEGYWEGTGYRFDEVRAVLATGYDQIGDAAERLAALKGMRQESDFTALAAAFKRASNILKQAEKNKLAVPGAVAEDKLIEEAERVLFTGVRRIEGEAVALLAGKDYRGALKVMVTLKSAVDSFFDKVMVMAEDEAVRSNRLALLRYATALFSRIVDFSQLQ